MPRSIFLIFVAFGLAIGGGSSFYYAWCWSDVLAGRRWPSVQGHIEAIDVEDHISQDSRGHSTTTYYPRFSYAYRAGNSVLHGSRIWLSGNQFYQHREDAVAFAQGYAVGQPVRVVYDPQDPQDAALLVEDPPWQILLFTAFGLLWIALALAFRLMDQGWPRRRFGICRKCGARLPIGADGPEDETVPADRAAKGPVAEGRPCPKCGQADPFNSLRNKPGCIIVMILFGGMWVVVIVAILSVF